MKAKAALQQAELNVERGRLLAPYDARIAQVHVSAGSRVNAGSTLITFYALDSLELRAKLPVAEKQSVEQALLGGKPIHAFYYGVDGEQALPLLRLAGEASTSGVDAFFALQDAAMSWRPGELMEVTLKGVAQEGVMAVPYSAIYGNDRLYIVKEGRLQSQTIEVMGEVMRNGRLWALVKADFAEGTRINITHLPNATTGLKVVEVSES